jgi:hypothetical protein
VSSKRIGNTLFLIRFSGFRSSCLKEMLNLIWAVGAAGYYSALVVWIVAQRTRHFHGKYSHSWMIGVLLLLFSTMQLVGAFSSVIALIALISLMMPLSVTAIDFSDHLKSGRGLFEHKANCWMESKRAGARREHSLLHEAASTLERST